MSALGLIWGNGLSTQVIMTPTPALLTHSCPHPYPASHPGCPFDQQPWGHVAPHVSVPGLASGTHRPRVGVRTGTRGLLLPHAWCARSCCCQGDSGIAGFHGSVSKFELWPLKNVIDVPTSFPTHSFKGV